MTEETMASRGQAAHRPDPKPAEGGPWTSHGHVIPGITIEGYGRPPVFRCGGPEMCKTCALDVTVLTSFPPPKVDPKSRAVELVAQAICDGDAADHGTYDWSEASEDLQDDYRRAARHALDAMDATAVSWRRRDRHRP